MGRAAGAKRDDPRHAIYATSFRKTPQTFPLVFARGVNYVHAVNVTDRYVNRAAKPPEGSILTMFAVRDDLLGGNRCSADIKIVGADGKAFFAGRTKDEQTFSVSGQDIDRATVRLCDDLVTMDEPITITTGDKKLFEGDISRTGERICHSPLGRPWLQSGDGLEPFLSLGPSIARRTAWIYTRR